MMSRKKRHPHLHNFRGDLNFFLENPKEIENFSIKRGTLTLKTPLGFNSRILISGFDPVFQSSFPSKIYTFIDTSLTRLIKNLLEEHSNFLEIRLNEKQT